MERRSNRGECLQLGFRVCPESHGGALTALPVVQAEVERLDRKRTRLGEVRGPPLEQQRVADPERSLRPNRDVVGATERERRGLQVIDTQPAEREEQVVASVPRQQRQPLVGSGEATFGRPNPVTGERRRLRAGPRGPGPIRLERAGASARAVRGARAAPDIVERRELAGGPRGPNPLDLTERVLLLERAQIGDQEGEPGALVPAGRG